MRMAVRTGGVRLGAFVLLGMLVSHTASAAELRESGGCNTGWRFERQTDPGSHIEWEFRDAWKPEFDDSHWSRVFLPHSWDQTAHSPWVAENHWRGIGWY